MQNFTNVIKIEYKMTHIYTDFSIHPNIVSIEGQTKSTTAYLPSSVLLNSVIEKKDNLYGT